MSNNNNNQFTMNLHLNKMQYLDINLRAAATATATPAAETGTENTSPSASPPDFDFNLPCRYFKSSFARSLSLNSTSNHCRSLDYEARGKSGNTSRSTQESCSENRKSVAAFLQRHSRASPPIAVATFSTGNESNNLPGNGNILVQNEGSCDSNQPPAIPARRLSTVAYNLEVPQNQQQQQKQQQHVPLAQFRPAADGTAASVLFNKMINPQQPHSLHHVVNNNNNNSNNKHRKNIVWPTDGSAGEQDFQDELSNEADDLEASNISNGDYMLTAERQPSASQQHQHQQHPRALFEPHEDVVNVEAVLLQNQVDTLQWQLKQVETSCEMYRAVMEEVARFLNRYHSQKQQQLLDRSNMEQITRSKSMHHVFVGTAGEDDGCNGGYEKLEECSHELSAAPCMRARSSTNLVDKKQASTTTKALSKKFKPPKSSADDHLYDVIASSKTYSDFKDYTWRRPPKKSREYNPLCGDADVEEKLNQEAFRLSRTITNLLSTSLQQPDLTQHRSPLAAGSLGRLRTMPASASNMALSQSLHNSTGLSTIGSDSSTAAFETTGSTKSNKLGNTTTTTGTATANEMLFLRSMNMRDSRLSLRSSTDSSVHSTSSSSKLETDEDHSPFLPPPHMHSAPKPIPQLGSTTEDESGFSSISSFQDIGVPLNSTMISTRNSISNGAMAVYEANDTSVLESHTLGGVDLNADSRNSTLKAAAMPPLTPTQLSNVVGIPTNSCVDMQQRWNSPSKTYRNVPNKLQQRFSTLSNDDSTMVLWV